MASMSSSESAAIVGRLSAGSYGSAELGRDAAAKEVQDEAISPFAAPVAEFVGTFVLVYVVGCVIASPAPAEWGGAAIAAALMVMIYATGPVSGGNLNPAVSFALFLSRNMSLKTMMMYWVAQVLGGLAGSGVSALICPNKRISVGPQKPFDWGAGFQMELFYTFVLTFVVLNCAASRRNNPKRDPNQFFALAIGFVVAAAAYGAGHISGACLNPAVALGLGFTIGDENSSFWALVWTAAELLGGMVAVGLYAIVRPEEFEMPSLEEEALEKYEPHISSCILSELLGTLVLVLTVNLNLLAESRSTAYSAAASLMVMIYSLGNVSGAHFNPAVTISIMVSGRGKCSLVQASLYIGTQLSIAFIAGMYSGMLKLGAIPEGDVTHLGHGKHYTNEQACLAEVVATFILAYVVLSVATVPHYSSLGKSKQNFVFGLAIASCVTAGGFSIGAASGGELNPAVCLGIASQTLLVTVHHDTWLNFALFSLSEIAGGILAAFAFRLTHPDEYMKEILP